MAVRPIRMLGDPVLRQKAKRVPKIDASVQTLVDDMIETMRDAPGVGLAANQVGVSLRVIVIEVPEEREEEDGAAERPLQRRLLTLINPQIVKRSGQRLLEEGCLSIPGYKAEVSRSVSVTVKGLNRDGKEVRVKAKDDLLAEALEHEIDHLNGVLYVDQLESMDQLIKLEEEPGDEEGEHSAGPAKASARQPAAGGEPEGAVKAPTAGGSP